MRPDLYGRSASCVSACKIDPPISGLDRLPALARSGRWGMLIVETIGRIRREHLDKGKSIKEIARTLHLSRNTVRRILRSGETAFSYEREVQPRPKLGPWTERARSAAGGERQGAGAREADADPHLRGVAGARLRGRLRRGSPLCAALGRAACERDGGSLRAADLCAGRSLPVRLTWGPSRQELLLE